MSSNYTDFLVSRQLILGQYQRCNSSDLEGWIEDARYSLEGTGLFTRMRVRKTGESDRMVEVTCVGQGTAEDVIGALESVWEWDLRYAHAAAHVTTRDERSVSLEYVTASEPGGVYITGCIVAHFNSDFAPR